MSVKIFDTMTTATPNFPLAYADKINVKLQDGSEADIQTLYNNGELSGGDTSLTVTEAEYLALPEEERLNNSYYLYDIGVHYKNGIAYSRKEPISLTMAEYKALDEVDPDQEYIITADEQGILLEASDIGYSNAVSNLPCTTVQGAVDKVAEKVDNLISDTDLTSTTSTYSSAKINEKIDGTIIPAKNITQYIKFTLRNYAKVDMITVADNYGGKIEILGSHDSAYSVPKVIRYSYGNWGIYDATKNPDYKIRGLYRYSDKNCYYLEIKPNTTISIQGALITPEVVTEIPIATSEMTLIPESNWGAIDDSTVATNTTWSSSKIASEIGRTQIPSVRTSTGWKATKDLSSLPIGTYRLTSMHSSSGSVIDALILKTGYSYFLKTILKEGANITVDISDDTLTVAESTTSIGIISVFLNVVGINA